MSNREQVEKMLRLWNSRRVGIKRLPASEQEDLIESILALDANSAPGIVVSTGRICRAGRALVKRMREGDPFLLMSTPPKCRGTGFVVSQ